MSSLSYLYPDTAAAATPPTLAQMVGKSEVIVDITADLYDESIVITHNFALTAQQLTDGFPDVEFEYPTVAAASSNPVISARAATTITVRNLSPGVIRAKITRPHSLTK